MVYGEEQEMKHFVTFEGIDGSGKSTICKLVYEKLKSQGYSVVLTFEPTDTYLGKCVKKCIEKESDPFITAFTFIADRIEHCKKIQKWLDEDKIVICDRYADSTYAYQGAQMQGIIDNPIKWLQELAKNQIIIPEKTFVFLIEPKDAIKRIQNRSNLIPFEKISFLEKVNKNYLKLSKGKRYEKIDATKSINELVDICFSKIIY
jgi:dTMP kinase